MGSAEVTIVAFGSISMVATAIGLVLRDLLFGSTSQRRKRLRREQTVYDRPVAQTLFGRIDQGFDRLVLESGLHFSPAAAFMALLASAVATGGAILVYTDQPLYAIGGAILGLFFPMLFFAMARRRRFREIRRQLPAMIDILARSSRAGRSIEQAIHLAATESKGVIATELQKLDQSLQMGASFEKAVKTFAVRLPLMEVRILATTLVVQRVSGGHLSETLDRMATVIRDRISTYNQIQATTGAGRLSTMVIAALAPVAFVSMMVVNPEHVQVLMDDRMGRYLLMLGVVLELVGLLWVVMLIRNDN